MIEGMQKDQDDLESRKIDRESKFENEKNSQIKPLYIRMRLEKNHFAQSYKTSKAKISKTR
jgi:hypothetical protein